MKVILIDEEGKELEYTNFILFARHKDENGTRCAADFKDVSASGMMNLIVTIVEAMEKHLLPLSLQKKQQEERKN